MIEVRIARVDRTARRGQIAPMHAIGVPFHASRSAWLWLVELPDLEIALQVGPHDALTAELQQHFDHVVVCHRDQLERLEPQAHSVAFMATTPGLGRDRGLRQALGALRRTLKSGAYLGLTQHNPFWHGAVRTPPGVAQLLTMSATRRMRAEGFADIRRYYLAPSADNPINVIPASRRAIQAHEHASAGGRMRRIAARLGAGPMLYPSQLTVGRV